jgi:hypothetical protein
MFALPLITVADHRRGFLLASSIKAQKSMRRPTPLDRRIMYSYNGGASMLRQLLRQMLRQRSESSAFTGHGPESPGIHAGDEWPS